MLRKIARPMLASFFVWDGVDTLRNTDQHIAETGKHVGAPAQGAATRVRRLHSK